MKHFLVLIFLTISSFIVNATTYNVIVNRNSGRSWDYGEINIDITSQLPQGTYLKKGDVVNFTLAGYFNIPVAVIINNLFDRSEEANWWFPLTEWIEADAGKAVVGKKYSYTQKFIITQDTKSNEYYTVQVELWKLEHNSDDIYLRPTLAELESIGHNEVEIANKKYKNLTLYNNNDDKYVYEENIATTVYYGDYFTFSVNGYTDSKFADMTAYLYDTKTNEVISNIVNFGNYDKNDNVKKSGTLTSTSKTDNCKFVISCTMKQPPIIISENKPQVNSEDKPQEGSDSNKEEYNKTSLKNMNISTLTIENNTVYSIGEIFVYDINGQIVATDFHSLDLSDLSHGLYIIIAPEGKIEYIKK